MGVKPRMRTVYFKVYRYVSSQIFQNGQQKFRFWGGHVFWSDVICYIQKFQENDSSIPAFKRQKNITGH